MSSGANRNAEAEAQAAYADALARSAVALTLRSDRMTGLSANAMPLSVLGEFVDAGIPDELTDKLVRFSFTLDGKAPDSMAETLSRTFLRSGWTEKDGALRLGTPTEQNR